MAVLVLGVHSGCRPSEEASSDKKANAKGKSASGDGLDGRAVLDRMVKAYRDASSYKDRGRLVMTGRVDGQPLDEPKADYRMVLERPGRMRLQVLGATAVSDGKTFQAEAQEAFGQVLRRPVGEKLGINTVFSDLMLARTMADSPAAHFSWLPLQAILLMANDPLKTLLFDASDVVLLEPKEVDDHRCHRVQVTRSDGKAVFWIDQETFVLRRFEFPLDGWMQRMRAKGVPLEEASLVAELSGARLDGPIEASAFEFTPPPGARTVDTLLPIGSGLPVPDFFLTGPDDKSVTKRSLDGKVVLMDIWSLNCQPCRLLFPELEKVYQKYKDNDKVAILAVNYDPPNTPVAEQQSLLKELGVHVPLYGDPRRFLQRVFQVPGVPTIVLLGPDGRLQYFHPGLRPNYAAVLTKMIERLLAGQDIDTSGLVQYQATSEHYRRMFDRMLQRDLFIDPETIANEIPLPGIADKSEPKKMRLSLLWECKEVASPGNLLVVEQKGGSARLFVLDGGRAVCELDNQGKLVKRYPLDLPESEVVLSLRTNVGADGKRYFAGSARGMQQVHLFDAGWKRLLSFPPDTHENPHAGVGDVELADFDGDGKLELAVGYQGVIGVKAVSLEGKILWSQRAVNGVVKMAAGPPDQDRWRPLLCTDTQVALIALGQEGQIIGRIALDNGQLLYWIDALPDAPQANTAGLCGLSAPQIGQNEALGISPTGDVLWSYQLPPGISNTPTERVVSGRLLPDDSNQWLLVGTDGSIHLVGADGRALDSFACGTPIHGLATTRLDGRPVLIISTREGVTAWSVAW
ncbi:MAG: redoxin domain-containing protein [Pirellulales bacterium]|nr:redoxin domain-containing protein [Pirellulales bacterium]